MSIISKLQNTFISLKQGHFTEQKKEEEICSYRTKQTKNRKTIFINCRDCNLGSSLNDTRCRKNILSILQKEVHADCLVLSRLYERDYEGDALALLYVLAGFNGIVTAYRSTQRVPEACNLPEKKECDLEREELISFFSETVEKKNGSPHHIISSRHLSYSLPFIMAATDPAFYLNSIIK